MTPPPPPDYPPPTGVRRPTQPAAPQVAAEVPDWVRDKLAEGERFFRDLQGEHKALAARVGEALVTIRDDIRGIREQMGEERKERRRQEGEVREELHDADDRLDQLAAGQAAQRAEMTAMAEGQRRQGEQLAQVVAGQAKQGEQLAQILEAVAAAKAVAADRAAQGQGGAGITPDGGALVPTTPSRRSQVAVAGGAAATLALTLVGALASLPPVLQWALAVALVVVVAGGTVVGVRLLSEPRR